MNKNKGIIGIGLILAIVLGIVVVGGGAYYLGTKNNLPPPPSKNIGGDPARVNSDNQSEENQNQNLPVVDNKSTTNTSSFITVLSPNGGEVYKDSDKIAIKWKSTGKDRIAIYLRFSSGEWCFIKDVPSNNTNYIFTPLGHDCGSGRGVISPGQYKVTLILYENGGMAPEPGTAFAGNYDDGDSYGNSIDSSDNSFTINSGTKTIWLKSPKFGLYYQNTLNIIEYYVDKFGKEVSQSQGGQPYFMGSFNNDKVEITWNGYNSACTIDQFGIFQYGISNHACVKGYQAWLVSPGPGVSTSLEERKTFGDFVLKNR